MPSRQLRWAAQASKWERRLQSALGPNHTVVLDRSGVQDLGPGTRVRANVMTCGTSFIVRYCIGGFLLPFVCTPRDAGSIDEEAMDARIPAIVDILNQAIVDIPHTTDAPGNNVPPVTPQQPVSLNELSADARRAYHFLLALGQHKKGKSFVLTNGHRSLQAKIGPRKAAPALVELVGAGFVQERRRTIIVRRPAA